MSPSAERLLLDTHVFLWWSDGADRLGSDARSAIRDAASIHVSIASAWELAIKTSVGKMRMSLPFRDAMAINGFDVLPIAMEHVERVATLPRHHGDPFDRLLAAQALHEGLTLVTHDRSFAPYGAAVRWA